MVSTQDANPKSKHFIYTTMSDLNLKVSELNHQSETPRLTEEKIHVTTCVIG